LGKARVRVEGLERLHLQEFATSLQNPREPLWKAITFLERSTKRDAQMGKKIGGGKFKPYSTSYAEFLARTGRLGGKRWLWLEGGMLSGMKKRVGKTSAEVGYWDQTKQTMKANVQQKGSNKQNIPARPWLGWRKGYQSYIEDKIFMSWIGKQADRSGFLWRQGV
jgi:hypothetical protein